MSVSEVVESALTNAILRIHVAFQKNGSLGLTIILLDGHPPLRYGALSARKCFMLWLCVALVVMR